MVDEIRVAEFGGTPWVQGLYQTSALTASNGRVPETVVARQLSWSLSNLGIDHVIRFGFDPFPASTEQSVCGTTAVTAVREQYDRVDTGMGVIGETDDPIPVAESVLQEFSTFLDASAPFVGADSNLVITGANGGGCAYVGGNAAAAPGGNIVIDPGIVVEFEQSAWARNTSACLHEIGHNMGFLHNPHPGWGFNDDLAGVWNRTPNNSANGVQNLCGTFIETRAFNPTISHLYYNDCVADHISIVDKAPLDQNGGGNGDGNGNGGGNGNGDGLNLALAAAATGIGWVFLFGVPEGWEL